MTIYISSHLSNTINSLGMSINQLSQDFDDLISKQPTNFFGKNKRNIRSDYVWHAHIIPDSTDPAQLMWMKTLSRRRRTSDNLLFYARDQANNFLLITIVKPGGHAIFSNMLYLQALEQIAYNFAILRMIP